ncbi:MAG TPA: YicC/YloC family endoribonuclease, partial [Candidatus Polarisedimenticolia bacterium]|nr:YicC/YloC family endoribonuclease [Candidatus Polarisedimenticolia bacterium]
MTGFGRGAAEDDAVRCEVEIKGVNHRFLDMKARLP